MSFSLILYYVGFFLLNPISFIVYLFAILPALEQLKYAPSIQMNGNMSRLQLLPVLLSVVLISGLFLLFSYLFLSALKDISLNTFLQPKSLYVQVSCFAVMAMVLFVFVSPQGVEGNIAGFIFFPFIAFASLILVGLHFFWIWKVVIKG